MSAGNVSSKQLSELSVEDEIAMKVHISSAHARIRELAGLLEVRHKEMTPTCKAVIADARALIERGKQWTL